MSLGAVNRALRPHALVWRRLLLTFAAVGAILVGLLAMHSLSTDAGHHGTTIAVASEAHHEHAESPALVPDECGGSCEPGHSTAIVACLLALLALTLLLALRETPTRGVDLQRVAALKSLWKTAAFRWPRPPSLTALSISRT